LQRACYKYFFILTWPLFFFNLNCRDKQENETKNVKRVISSLIEADNHSDLDAVLRSYTDSIEFYPTGREFTKGIDNIRNNYIQLFKSNRLSITTQILETRIYGNDAVVTGINRGTLHSLTDSSVKSIDDKYIALLICGPDKKWKIDKLIWGIHH
jgi:uncharacterized protein (TIGR02246 family)